MQKHFMGMPGRRLVAHLRKKSSAYRTLAGLAVMANDAFTRFYARPHGWKILEKAGDHAHEAYVWMYNLGDVPVAYFMSMAADIASRRLKGPSKYTVRYAMPAIATAIAEIAAGTPELNDFLLGLSGMALYYAPDIASGMASLARKAYERIKPRLRPAKQSPVS